MKRILLGIIIGIIAFVIFIMAGGGEYLKRLGQKTEEAGRRLESYEKRLKSSVKETKQRIETLKEKTEKRIKDTVDRIEHRLGIDEQER